MIARPFWQQRIEVAWREAPIAWLAGVRRAGKTVLAESLGADRLLYLSEVDFVTTSGRDQVDAIECKWNPDAFDATALKAFRSYYPQGRNYLVTPSGDPPYTKRFGDMEVRICTPTELVP